LRRNGAEVRAQQVMIDFETHSECSSFENVTVSGAPDIGARRLKGDRAQRRQAGRAQRFTTSV
jgi:hypothetical protein